jgi:hypothetical protein
VIEGFSFSGSDSSAVATPSISTEKQHQRQMGISDWKSVDILN